MQHITYSDSGNYPIAILIKSSAFSVHDIERAYSNPLEAMGVNKDHITACSLPYTSKGKAPVTFIKEQLEDILLALNDVNTRYIYCADANYFKTLTKKQKADPHLGYVLPCALQGYEHMQVILGVNYRSLMYNPQNEPKLKLSLDTLVGAINGSHVDLGTNIIHYEAYPQNNSDIINWLTRLLEYEELTCDIETFSLKHNLAGVATIGFAWSENTGIAFPCDYACSLLSSELTEDYGWFKKNVPIRTALKKFFEQYKGKLIFHSCTFDIKNLIYSLWMEHPLDTVGLLKGLHILFRDTEDTKILAYLCTNTTAGNKLSLKELAHSFAGNWAQADIKDIRKIPLSDLLQYNLVDCLSTFHVYNKYRPMLFTENQEDIYFSLMMPSQKTITQMELTGLPLNANEVARARKGLEEIVAVHQTVLDNTPIVALATTELRKREMAAANSKLKVKQHPLSHFDYVVLNPNSSQQLQVLLYELMLLPVIDLTDTKLPATGAKTLAKLRNHTTDPDYLAVLDALIGLSKAAKILSTFIPAFEQSIKKDDGVMWLHGNFNLGGTVSGRLSSSSPNLQNIPSGSTYGKLVKKCFQAPDGWIFSGADFHSLEDYISALTTRDPNKMKVYLDGYDGHCLKAFSYFKDQMPDIHLADTEECFRISVGEDVYYAKSGDTLVLPNGEKITV